MLIFPIILVFIFLSRFKTTHISLQVMIVTKAQYIPESSIYPDKNKN
tara:strand:- start:351 stop:491 length:141 start_codon:yes stop_codon:yes gene_type:complete